jgi:uncharacterized lipoprotein NlpE involved in copper resistance
MPRKTIKVKQTLVIVLLLSLLSSCSNSGGKSEAGMTEQEKALQEPPPPPKLAVDHYYGTLPCADCAGIETELSLKSDSTWMMHIIYDKRPAKGPGSNEMSEEGMWMMHGDTLHLMGRKDAPSMYIKTDSSLIQLDMNGKKIEGKLAEKYVLKKM